jgi:hypothetical protein
MQLRWIVKKKSWSIAPQVDIFFLDEKNLISTTFLDQYKLLSILPGPAAHYRTHTGCKVTEGLPHTEEKSLVCFKFEKSLLSCL